MLVQDSEKKRDPVAPDTAPARTGAPKRAGGVVVTGAVAAVSAAAWFSGEPTPAALFYVWPALYAGYFFSARATVASLALIGVAYAGVVAALGADGAADVTSWLVTLTVAAGSAAALYAARAKHDALAARVHELVRTDPLTGLPNRRSFEERFAVELQRADRSGEPLALAVGDLDFFKRVNDVWGHAAGDRTLKAVGATIAHWTRSADTPARTDGEGFAVLLPATAGVDAVDAVERLRKQVWESSSDVGTPVTISFGIAEFPRHGRTTAELLAAGEKALSEAKAQGRNRIVFDPGAPRAAV